jgi:hypothetical protein
MANKHNHYPIPILPPLAIPTALGLSAFVGFTHRNSRPRPRLAAIILICVCGVGLIALLSIPKIPHGLVWPCAALVAIVTIGGLLAIEAERRRWADAQLAVYFLTVGALAVGVQAGIMPAQDDYRPQADLARQADTIVPAHAMIYLLGNREEEHEAQYAFYLRPPIQRVDDFNVFKSSCPVDESYEMIPAGMLGDLSALGRVEVLATCSALRLHETEANRVLLVRLNPTTRISDSTSVSARRSLSTTVPSLTPTLNIPGSR